MTPADLPDALASAIRACASADERAVKTEGVEALLAKREWRRQEHRVTGLEHAVSVITATGPEEDDRAALRYAAGPNPDASPAGLTGGSMSIQGESVGKMDSPVKPANDDRGDGV